MLRPILMVRILPGVTGLEPASYCYEPRVSDALVN